MRAETVGSVENMSRDLNVFVYKWKGRDRKWPKESIFFSSPETSKLFNLETFGILSKC